MLRYSVWMLVFIAITGAAFAQDSTSPTINSGVVMSDGSMIEGKVSSTPGRPIRFFKDGKLAGKYTINQMAHIAFRPVNKKMEQLWRFPEFGSDEKDKTGEPFPMHDLEADLTLKN
ncbi:MAG: hypothetical protein ACOC2L_01650, partial [Candidatus Sumerlaeota bacterium]